MKTCKLLVPVLTLGLLAMSCSKSSGPAAVNPTAAKQAFTDVNNSLGTEISGLNTAPGGVAAASFSSLAGMPGNPLGRVKSFNKPGEIRANITNSIQGIRQMLMKGTASERVSGDQPFDFNGKKGVYTWSKANHSFSKTAASEIIKIDYPTDTTSNTNDAELQISEYNEQDFTSIGKGYQPTSIKAAIYINNVKEMGLTLTAGYDSNGDANKGSIDLFINPYTISWSFDDSGAASASESFSFSKAGTTLIATSATATWSTSASKTAGDPPIGLTGYVQLKNVKFNITIDGNKAATATSNNDFIFITVTVDGGVAGHVVWVYDNTTQQEEPYVQYNDGTQEPLKTIFADLATQLQSIG